jgi:hypothetical protein
LFTHEFSFQIREQKDVTSTDIMAIGRLGSMTELTALKTILSPAKPMKCGIVKMHYHSWRTFCSLAVQSLRKRLEHLLTKLAAVGPFSGASQFMKMAP